MEQKEKGRSAPVKKKRDKRPAATHKQQKMQHNKEQNLREVLGFFSNQIDGNKFLQKTHVRNIVDGVEVEEKIQDEFLNTNEFAEIKGSYDDYNIGDITIVFPNPDSVECKNKAITFKEAETVFDQMLTVMTDEGASKDLIKKERDAFLLSFLTLNDYKEDVDQKKLEKKKLKKQKKQKEDEKAGKYRRKSQQTQSLDLDRHDKKKKHKIRTTYDKYKEFMELYEKNEKFFAAAEDQPKQQKVPKASAKKEEAYLEEIGLELERPEINPNLLVDPVKELMKVNIQDKSQFKRVKKSWSQGGFLFMKYIDATDYDWICKNQPPKDFLTLVRFTVMTKLSRNGFLHCRTFVSMTGIYLFVVVKSSKQIITREAQLMRLTKQIELGYADLFSLEPVDHQFRPLRLKRYLRNADEQDIRERVEAMLRNEKDIKRKEEEFVRNNTETEEQGAKNKTSKKKLNYSEQLIADHCRALYPKVCQWTDLDLRALLIIKQTEADEYMKFIAEDLNIDQSYKKVEIIDDLGISRQQWEAYYIYLEYIVCYAQYIQELKEKKYPQVEENLAFIYKLIFRKAVGDANEYWYDRHFNIIKELTQQKQILKTLWARLDVEPVPPYTDYFQPINEAGSRMWRKYEVNEQGLRSEFINMEKIKITNTIIQKNVNIPLLVTSQMIFAYFPIHDHYQMRGVSKDPFFTSLREAGFTYSKVEQAGDLELKRLFNQLKDEAEATDFDSESLEKESQFNIKIPWWVPISSFRDYFGEKIALYFDFLSYYTKQLWYMAIIGTVAQGFMFSKNDALRTFIIVFFAIIIIIWSTVFIEFWKREQVLFAVQYGQQNFEEDEAIRPAFVGTYIRSITNDDLNEEFYSPFLRKMKQLFSLGVSFLIIGCVLGCVYGIFTFKSQLIDEKQPQEIIQVVPAILNSMQIGIFNALYGYLVQVFNRFENHKILSSYENALIAKVFIFMFVNNFNSLFIIAFLSNQFPQLNLCALSTSASAAASVSTRLLQDNSTQVQSTTIIINCFGVLENQMMIIFLSTIVKNLPELLMPIAKALVIKRTRQIDEKPVVHAFNMIDNAIEDQLELEQYQTNEEVDGTVNDYMELVIQFSYLCLFGLAFPLSYMIAFISNILEIQVDKLKLVRFERRPFPQGASNIGNWLVILEVITFFGIFSNAGLIVYTSETIREETRLITFSSLLILFLALKYFIRFIVPDEPESALILNKRHRYVVDKVIKGFQSIRYKQYNPAKPQFISIGGIDASGRFGGKIEEEEMQEEEEDILSSPKQDNQQAPG